MHLAQTVQLLPAYPTPLPTATAIIEPTPIEALATPPSYSGFLLFFAVAWVLGCLAGRAFYINRIRSLTERLSIANVMLHGSPSHESGPWWNRGGNN